MSIKEKLAGSKDLLRKLWFLARPYGLLKPVLVLLVILLQGVLQVAGVTSVIPFLVLASDPDAFRISGLGAAVLRHLPPMDNAKLLVWSGIFSVVVLILSNATNLLSDYARALYAHGLAHWLRLRVLRQIVSRPWSYFLAQNSGVLIKKTTWDVTNMANNVMLPLLEGTARLVTALFLVVALVLINPVVALGAAFVLTVFYVIVFVVLRKSRRNLSYSGKQADRGSFKEAQQLLGGIKTVKIHRAEQFFIGKYAAHSRILASISSKTPLHWQGPKYLLEPVAFGGVILIVIAYAGLGLGLGEILPTLGVVGLAGYRLLPAVQLLYAQVAQIGTNRHALDEVYEEFANEQGMLDQETKSSTIQGPPQPLDWSDRVQFDKVTFRYSSAGKDVISELSFSIPRCSSVGVIGQTGAGKSTLVDLLMGLHIPAAGRILVDGVPLTKDTIGHWQAGLGYVPQEIFLMDDTIARNIALGVEDKDIDTALLREAAASASILDFIDKELPEGFNTHVGERGVRLSGGQRQRIALARALYRRPRLLILDEATSALDNETEAQVVEAINRLQGEVTMVVVAHRLSTIERCQFVLDLSDGEQRMQTQRHRHNIP